MARRCFFSFHYEPDVFRVSQIREIGAIEGNRPATDNDWEKVTSGKERAIKKWIAEQMRGRSCTIVLVGSNTANRKWINYEIAKSWDDGLGVVGIYIHGLEDSQGLVATRGGDPFFYINYGNTGKKLSSIVKCYKPQGITSNSRYEWIAKHLANAVEEAIEIQATH